MNQYMIGSDIIGAEVNYGPVSPEQLAHANRPLTLEEQKAASEWNYAHPNFWQRPVLGKFNGTQVVVGGAGLALILGGIVTLIVRRK